MHAPTIKVKPAHASQGDHVVINAADFDPAVHERVEPVAEPVEAPAAPKAPRGKKGE